MDDQINKLVHESLGKCAHEYLKTGLVESGNQGAFACTKCAKPSPHDYGIIGMPYYTTSLDAAMEYAEKLIADGWDWSAGVSLRFAGKDQEYYSIFRLYSPDEVSHEGCDVSFARAICIAGLRAEGRYDLVQSEQHATQADANDPKSSREAK
jgi:hypothetical protein